MKLKYSVLLISMIILGVLLITSQKFLLDNEISKNDNNSDEEFKILEYNENNLKKEYIILYETVLGNGEVSDYEIYEDTKNKFHFIYFVRKKSSNKNYPTFLLFSKYEGNINYKYYTDRISFRMQKGVCHELRQTDSKSEYHCIIADGNLNDLNFIDYEVGLYDNSKKQEQDFENENYEHALFETNVRFDFKEK